MARPATIDKDLFNTVRVYAQTHDKKTCCKYFGIGLSTLNNVLRYESFEEMRHKICASARERYEARKSTAAKPTSAPKPAGAVTSKPETTKLLEAPKQAEPETDWEKAYKNLLTRYEALAHSHQKQKSDFEQQVIELRSALESKQKMSEALIVENDRLSKKLKEADNCLAQVNELHACDQGNCGCVAGGSVLIEVGNIKITVREEANA